jgi:hypothetical protein
MAAPPSPQPRTSRPPSQGGVPVAAAVDDAQDFNPIAQGTIDDDEREPRHHKLARTIQPSPATHPWMGIEVRSGIVESGSDLCRGGPVACGDVVDDLVEVVDGFFESDNGHRLRR